MQIFLEMNGKGILLSLLKEMPSKTGQ
jgi:hypothetical protein